MQSLQFRQFLKGAALAARPQSLRQHHVSVQRPQLAKAASQASQISLAEPTAYNKLKEVYDYLQSLPPSDVSPGLEKRLR